jgi:hypothetical protein
MSQYISNQRTCISDKQNKSSNLQTYELEIKATVNYQLKKKKLRGLSPQANYTNGATATCQWL